jgi:hypothetical protein
VKVRSQRLDVALRRKVKVAQNGTLARHPPSRDAAGSETRLGEPMLSQCQERGEGINPSRKTGSLHNGRTMAQTGMANGHEPGASTREGAESCRRGFISFDPRSDPFNTGLDTARGGHRGTDPNFGRSAFGPSGQTDLYCFDTANGRVRPQVRPNRSQTKGDGGPSGSSRSICSCVY